MAQHEVRIGGQTGERSISRPEQEMRVNRTDKKKPHLITEVLTASDGAV